LLPVLQQQLEQAGCDLVHANSLSMGRLTGGLVAESPWPRVAHLRDIIKLSKSGTAELNRNSRLVAVSEATRTFHIAQGLSAEKAVTIYNGVDCQRFQPRSADGEIRRELGLSPEDFLVLTVGQIGLRKGQDVLAAAAELLAPRLPRVHYLLAGERCSEKQESREFEQIVIARLKGLGAGDRLHLLGYREDMPRLMNAANVLVHPTNQEPLGRVLLEAAASGLPIIATDVGGTPEILNDGESALLVPPNRPESLADAILNLANNAALRSQLANNARNRILEKFPIQTAAENLRTLWAKVLEEHSTRPQ
jgi:glycosyltransferase involved in cell wall biosynthesis